MAAELTAEAIGMALLGWAGASQALRHESPVGSLVYVQPATPADYLVRDFIAWCSGHGEDMVPGSVERMKAVGAEWSEILAADLDPLAPTAAEKGAA